MYDGPSQHSPERDLWQAVLLQVIADAFHSPSGIGKPVTRELVKREAIDYLTRPSKDLATLCALAGVDMGALIARMLHQPITVVAFKPVNGKGSIAYQQNSKSVMRQVAHRDESLPENDAFKIPSRS